MNLSTTLAGPFSLAFDTPGFINPDDNGPVAFSVPAGSLYRIVAFNTSDYNSAGTLMVKSGVSSDDAHLVMGTFTGDRYAQGAVAIGEPDLDPLAPNVQYARWLMAFEPVVVCVAYYPVGQDPIAGATDLYLLTLTQT